MYYITGANCSEMVDSEDYRPPFMPFRCELSLSNSHPEIEITDILHVSEQFDPKFGKFIYHFRQL